MRNTSERFPRVNAMAREDGWGIVTDAALGILPEDVESQARVVARWAAARIKELEAEVLTWRKVAQSATPGGSEYMHPERVKSHIDEMREALHNARCDAVKQRRRAEAAEAKLTIALEGDA